MERLKRLIVTEAKAVPNFKPIYLYLSHLSSTTTKKHNNNSSPNIIIDDNALLDFLTFRGIDGSKSAATQFSSSSTKFNVSAASNHHHHSGGQQQLPQMTTELLKSVRSIQMSNNNNRSEDQQLHQSSTSTNKRKNRIVFCDTSILLQGQQSLASLEAAAANPSNPILSFVFPFSALLLARFQMSQPEGSVSSAFKVSAYSQLRQLASMATTSTNNNGSLNNNNNKNNNSQLITIPPKVSILSPSAEIDLLCRIQDSSSKKKSLFLNQASNPMIAEKVLAENCISGEGAFFAHVIMPFIIMAAQRDYFGNVAGRSCVAVCGSAHRQVQSQCLKMGMPCDSLSLLNTTGASSNSNNNNSSGVVVDSSGLNFHHRKASDLCRRYVQKLKNIEEVSSMKR